MADREPRADLAKRLRSALMAQQVALYIGFSWRSVPVWVIHYNREGLSGWETKAGRDRKPPNATSRPPAVRIPRRRSTARTARDADPPLGSHRNATSRSLTNAAATCRATG